MDEGKKYIGCSLFQLWVMAATLQFLQPLTKSGDPGTLVVAPLSGPSGLSSALRL
jgi:hypothetical protein